MKRIALTIAVAALGSTVVHAAPVTSISGGTVVPMESLNYNGSGPVVQAPGITWSANSGGAVFGWTYEYGFGDNGLWSGSIPMIGSNSSGATMEYQFSTLQSAVGGFLNYAPDEIGPATISIFDSSHSLIESYTLSFSTDGGIDRGEFHGFQVPTASIAYFALSGAYIGMSDLTVAAVPEPETYAMLLAGLGLLGFVAKRRKQEAA